MKGTGIGCTLAPECCQLSWWKLLTKMSLNKVRSSGSLANQDDIVKAGYLKKIKEKCGERSTDRSSILHNTAALLISKTMKKKYYVLRRETGPDSPARLEYYDSEKKFKSGAQAKKPIILRTCFSINHKKDPKLNHVIALYTNHYSVSMAADSEGELNDWLGFLHHHMHQAVAGSDGQSRRLYEHVWLVVVQPRSLGSSKGITGDYHICLTCRSIALVKVGDCSKKYEFPLNSIRRCGHTGSFFFLGLGRSAVTGAGDIWMLTEDAVIAENMHSIIRKAMHDPCNNNTNEDPVSRERTKSMSNHRSYDGRGWDPFLTFGRLYSSPPSMPTLHPPSLPPFASVLSGGAPCHIRDRCGSMPTRSRTSSEGSVQAVPIKHHPPSCSHQIDSNMPGSLCLHPITRPKSMYSSSLSSSCSPPFASALFSPSSSESMESTASVDELDGHPSHTPENITENFYGDDDGYMPMGIMNCGESGEKSSMQRETPQPPLSLPIISPRSIVHQLSKGLVSAGLISPVSASSTEGGCLSSPQYNYREMASPSEGLASSDLEPYLRMERCPPQTQGNSSSDHLSYLSMAPLCSPGSAHPSWPPQPSSQVSSPPHSANHSRMSSLVDDDCYLPMIPGGHIGEVAPSSSDVYSRERSSAYLDMTRTPAVPTPIPYSPSDGDSVPEMSPGSSCSFTSGTPSSDHRFPEYIAEKSGSGSYYGYSEDDDSSIERPIRTNSVGSKPEQFRSRKNRLEVSPAEPARVRAFSVGSRVGLRLPGGRTGQVASGVVAATSACITEFSPSIKEKGKQVKNKSTSAPILGSSPISNSWSGTPGTFFRGFLQARNQERNNDLMELDFTKNKSCDSISADKEKKSSSIESIKRTLTGQRHRSNSKSSGNGKSSVFDSLKRDKSKSESESYCKGIEIPENKDYCEVEINPSPRRNTDSHDGYLPMKPAIVSSSLSSNKEYMEMNSKDHIPRQCFVDSYLDMSRSSDRLVSSLGSSGSRDGEYVDMTEGKGLGPHLVTSVSSSTTASNSSSSIGARVRKISSNFNSLSSQDFPPQLDEYMSVDFRTNLESSCHSLDGEKSRKKKSVKKKSFKESSKRKKSDPIAVSGKGSDGEGVHEGSKKGTSPLSTLSTFLGRKNSAGTPPRTPLSPTGSPLPKSSRGTPSPLSSLTRNKNRDSKEISKDGVAKEGSGVTSSIGTSCIEESSKEAEESAISGESSAITAYSHTVPTSDEHLSKQSTNTGGSKRTSGIFESSETDSKLEEREKVSSESGSRNVLVCNTHNSNSGSGEMGAYVNLTPGSLDKNLSVETKQRKVSTGSTSSDYMNISPMASNKVSETDTQQHHEYVNMCPGGVPEPTRHVPSSVSSQSHLSSRTSPKPSAVGRSNAAEKNSPKLGQVVSKDQLRRESRTSSSGEGEGSGESGYLIMTPGQPPPKPTSPRLVARRPDIPPALLGGRPDSCLSATLERLNLGNSGVNSSISERCRSLSGPGAPEGSAVGTEMRVKKQLSEPRNGSGSQGSGGRAASACSSPVSYSPPTSPTLGGSVSSVSSLSEGGLSSASSTCTVVNVGVARREGGLVGSSQVKDNPGDVSAHATFSSSSSQQSLTTASTGSRDSGLNYVSLDLGPARCEGVMHSPRAGRRSASGSVTHGVCPDEGVVGEEEEPLSYAQIDFTKSEGLRTTSLSRDHRH